MKTSSVASKNHTTPISTRITVESYPRNEAEEPPSKTLFAKKIEDEPPGKNATGRYKLFGNVPDSSWNDWKWHFRNRITTVDQLSRLVPLSIEEKTQIELVAGRYPLAITLTTCRLSTPMTPMTR